MSLTSCLSIKLTRPSGNIAVNTVPLLSEIVLNALQTVKSRHFLRSFIRTWLSPGVVGRVLV